MFDPSLVRNAAVVEAPTGSGKTYAAFREVKRRVEAGERVIYVTPLRALAAELAAQWGPVLAPHPVGIYTGDYPGSRVPVPYKSARVYVMTPERLDACLRSWARHWHWLPDVRLVVLDEAHLLADIHRGPRLEALVPRLRRMNPFVRFTGLSATLGNGAELAEWLGGTHVRIEERPVPLRWSVVRYRDAREKPALLERVVRSTLEAGGKSLVFVESRRRAETLQERLSAAGMAAAHHHAGLRPSARHAAEEGFRNGATSVLVATSTLAMGLNLPVRQVVLYDLQHFNGTGFDPLLVRQVWQRAGRAGRPGLDEHGEVVLIAAQWDSHAASYATGTPEPVASALDAATAAEQVVVEVGSRLSRTSPQVVRALSRTLAAQQGRQPDVARLLDDLERTNLVETRVETRRSPRLHVTPAGRVMVRHLLRIDTVRHLRAFSRSSSGHVQPPTHKSASPSSVPLVVPETGWAYLDALLVVTASPDLTPVLPVDFEELEALAAALRSYPSYLLQMDREVLEAWLGVRGQRLLAALKMAALLRSWIEEGSADTLAERYGCYPFEVECLIERVTRLLLAWIDLVGCLSPPAGDDDADEPVSPLHSRLTSLRLMVQGGLDTEAATLTYIRGIGPVSARRLVDHGIADLNALAHCALENLAAIPGVGAATAARWIEEAGARAGEVPVFAADSGPYAPVETLDWPEGIDPYRLRRALDLTVERHSATRYGVSGGLDPHIVGYRGRTWTCDCPDAAKGRLCKHVLAVRLRRGDTVLRDAAQHLGRVASGDALNLFTLWYA